MELELLENEIINGFEKFKTIKLKRSKESFLHSKDYYMYRIWNGNLEDIKKIKIKLIVVDNNDLKDIFKYYRKYVSSLIQQQNSKLVGRVIEILVQDEITNKYLGLLALSSDYLHLKARDDYIEWTQNEKINNKKLNYIMNIATCVPLQPFGFNFTGGKLLVKLVFSEEMQKIFINKYGHNLIGITTTGLYGKSIQYDRLREIKFIGFTKGYSVYKFSTEFIQKCKKLLHEKYKINIMSYNKLHVISSILQKLDLSKEYMLDNPKGIYFGFVYQNAKDFLNGNTTTFIESKLPTVNEIFNEWLNRWCIQRYNHLIKTNRLEIINNINSTEKSKKSVKKLKDKIGEEEYKKLHNERIKKYRQNKKIELNTI